LLFSVKTEKLFPEPTGLKSKDPQLMAFIVRTFNQTLSEV